MLIREGAFEILVNAVLPKMDNPTIWTVPINVDIVTIRQFQHFCTVWACLRTSDCRRCARWASYLIEPFVNSPIGQHTQHPLNESTSRFQFPALYREAEAVEVGALKAGPVFPMTSAVSSNEVIISHRPKKRRFLSEAATAHRHQGT